MLCKTLFTMMPEVERFAAREVPKKRQKVAVQLALRLVRLREAWGALNKVRSGLLDGYERTEDGNLKPADAAEFSEGWEAALEQEAEITVSAVDELIEGHDVSSSEIAALVAVGLYEPDTGEEMEEDDDG